MMQQERGFSTIEVIVALLLVAIIGYGAMITIFQVTRANERSNDHITAAREVSNAGFWLSRDAQMAEDVKTDNLSADEFVELSWTEWNYGADTVYHTVTYSFTELSGNVGKLVRHHWSSAGANEDTLIARNMHYDPADPVSTCNVSYSNPVLEVKLAAVFGQAEEVRELCIANRPTDL